MNQKVILSLFDHSGNWSKPYLENGYDVIQVDIKNGIDVFRVMEVALQDAQEGATVHGILAAPPCTDFASSGARHWRNKEIQPAEYESHYTGLKFENTVELSVFLVIATLEIIRVFNPVFWALENPVGRINSLVPELKPYGPKYFNPCDYGDPYTKKTGLWGNFTMPVRNPVLPLFGSEIWSRYGGSSKRTKTLRSITPTGFSNAFFKSNP